MKPLLFDTDVLIDILRGRQPTINGIKKIAKDRLCYCSCITVGEIFAGMLPHEEKATRLLLESLGKLPITSEIAELAGTLKRKTRTHALQLADCMIASTALLYNHTLITNNRKHYPFRELEILSISS